MQRISVLKEPDGWRAFIKEGDKVTVLDGFYEDEIEAAQAALALQI